MSLENAAISVTNDLPIKHLGEVHDGKVRSVYWQNEEDSLRIGEMFGISAKQNTGTGVMVISDRISAFDCIWEGEDGLTGMPGKGAALNATSEHWFGEFEKRGLAGNHILATPHPLVWIVQKADQIMVEAIARQYITGSMWRDYNKGAREFCGISLPEGLQKNQRLDELLITPSTKGILKGIPGVPEKDDVNITRQQIVDNHKAFRFKSTEDVEQYENLLKEGFYLIGGDLAKFGKVFVDTKFEFGYLKDKDGNLMMVYIDEIGTPDSSRYWDKEKYEQGVIVEESKEIFRENLLHRLDRDVLLNKQRMPERKELAKTYKVPVEDMMEVSDLYKRLAEQITGKPVPKIENAREEIVESLSKLELIE